MSFPSYAPVSGIKITESDPFPGPQRGQEHLSLECPVFWLQCVYHTNVPSEGFVGLARNRLVAVMLGIGAPGRMSAHSWTIVHLWGRLGIWAWARQRAFVRWPLGAQCQCFRPFVRRVTAKRLQIVWHI